MATLTDEWHLAAARVSPLIWEVQKAHDWTIARARARLKKLPKIARIEDYIGILGSEPEMESLRDRLVITPVNYPKTKYHEPFLVERGRDVEVYDWDGEVAYTGELLPEYDANYLKWCAGFFVRLLGVKPPMRGP